MFSVENIVNYICAIVFDLKIFKNASLLTYLMFKCTGRV